MNPTLSPMSRFLATVTDDEFARLRYPEQVVVNGRRDGLTLADIGRQLGVTRERVRAVEARAVHKVKGWRAER